MAGFYFLSLAILLALTKDTNAAEGELNDVCKSDQTCTDATAVCDSIAKKCLYKDGADCTAHVTYCTTGATCSTTCSCASVYTVHATGICKPKDKKVGGVCTDTCDDANAECTGTTGSKTCSCKTGYTVKYSDLTCSGAGNILGSLIVLMASVLLSSRLG